VLKPEQVQRRWFCLIFLGAAFLMVVLGSTVLSSRLSGMTFLLYWFVCLFLTIFAMIAALIDVMAIRRSAMEEQKRLIEETIRRAQEKKNKEEN
jgi:4-hydroxybenzoate polyprenyltransferase